MNRVLARLTWLVVLACCSPSGVLAAVSENANHATTAAQYLSVGDLSRLVRSQGLIHIVDLRDEDAFARYHIDGAVRLGPLQLRTLNAWSSESVVLVGSGAAYQALESLQAQLIRDGFSNVRILDGGTRRWQQLNHSKLRALIPLGVAQIDLAGDSARWLVLNLDDDPIELPDGVLAIHAPGTDAREATKQLRLALAQTEHARGDRILNVLVVSSSSNTAMELAADLSSRVGANVFALAGDSTGFKSLDELRAAITKPKDLSAVSASGGQCW